MVVVARDVFACDFSDHLRMRSSWKGAAVEFPFLLIDGCAGPLGYLSAQQLAGGSVGKLQLGPA